MVQSDEEKKKKRTEYRKKNKEKINEYNREWSRKNKDEINEKRRKEYQDNKEKHNAWKRAYRARPEIREKEKKQQNERRAKNPQYHRDKQKEYREKNLDAHRKRARVYHNKIAKPKFEEIKLEILTYYSKKISKSEIPCCACCGENSSITFLALDHIEGRKSMGHKRGFTGIKIYKWIVKNDFPDGFQVLCHNCNTAKFQIGKCPHQN